MNIQSIFWEIQTNLYDMRLTFYTQDDILGAIQEAYNKLVGMLTPIEKSTLIPMLPSPYYRLDKIIPDFMYISGIFNPNTNLWLEGMTYKQMKATYQTYLAIGQPKWVNIVDFNRVVIWPYLPGATGVLLVMFKASAPPVTLSHIPILPLSVGPQLLEYCATAELLEQNREFKKARLWLDRAFTPNRLTDGKSLYEVAKQEIQSIARMDKENVLEPYRWIFHGGTGAVGGNVASNWISNEIPGGTIDGSNAIFTLSQIPSPTSSLILTLNGQILYQGTGYNLNGNTITFQSGYIPQVNGELPDAIRAWYIVT